MKKIIIGSLLVAGLFTGYAFAHGNGQGSMGWSGSQMMGQGGHHMMGQGGGQDGMMRQDSMRGNCSGPQSFLGNKAFSNEQHQQFLDATSELRKQMNEKRFELREASRKPDATPTQLAAIEKQLIDIRAQIHEQALLLQKSTK